jgi:hypothetical protein
MAEHGMADYGMAKRKAARSLGVGEGEALPTNEEIETELRAWQSLYQEDEQRERVHDLRSTALEVMEAAGRFPPLSHRRRPERHGRPLFGDRDRPVCRQQQRCRDCASIFWHFL